MINEVTKFEFKGELFDTREDAVNAQRADEIKLKLMEERKDIPTWQIEEIIKHIRKTFILVPLANVPGYTK